MMSCCNKASVGVVEEAVTSDRSVAEEALTSDRNRICVEIIQLLLIYQQEFLLTTEREASGGRDADKTVLQIQQEWLGSSVKSAELGEQFERSFDALREELRKIDSDIALSIDTDEVGNGQQWYKCSNKISTVFAEIEGLMGGQSDEWKFVKILLANQATATKKASAAVQSAFVAAREAREAKDESRLLRERFNKLQQEKIDSLLAKNGIQLTAESERIKALEAGGIEEANQEKLNQLLKKLSDAESIVTQESGEMVKKVLENAGIKLAEDRALEILKMAERNILNLVQDLSHDRTPLSFFTKYIESCFEKTRTAITTLASNPDISKLEKQTELGVDAKLISDVSGFCTKISENKMPDELLENFLLLSCEASVPYRTEYSRAFKFIISFMLLLQVINDSKREPKLVLTLYLKLACTIYDQAANSQSVSNDMSQQSNGDYLSSCKELEAVFEAMGKPVVNLYKQLKASPFAYSNFHEVENLSQLVKGVQQSIQKRQHQTARSRMAHVLHTYAADSFTNRSSGRAYSLACMLGISEDKLPHELTDTQFKLFLLQYSHMMNQKVAVQHSTVIAQP